MHCKRCGKALGTDRGVCPFCGALLSKEQMEIYREDKKNNMYKPELLTERYGEKKVIYEQREQESSLLFTILIILGIVLIIAVVVLIIVLNR